MVPALSIPLRGWVPAALSILFAYAMHDLISAHFSLQWSVARHCMGLGEFDRRGLDSVLGLLAWYRAGAGLLAAGFAICSICCRPRWPGIVALAFLAVAFVDVFHQL